jgi:hypothetical protein
MYMIYFLQGGNIGGKVSVFRSGAIGPLSQASRSFSISAREKFRFLSSSEVAYSSAKLIMIRLRNEKNP